MKTDSSLTVKISSENNVDKAAVSSIRIPLSASEKIVLQRMANHPNCFGVRNRLSFRKSEGPFQADIRFRLNFPERPDQVFQ